MAAGGNKGLDVGSPIPAAAGPSIIITEIMYNPASKEDNWEWVEIYNTTGAAIDIAGWVIDDINGTAHGSANIAAGVVPANSSAVLFNADDISAADFEAAWGAGATLIAATNWAAMALNNGGDQVGLWDSFANYSGDNTVHANTVVTVDYDDAAPWPVDDGSGSIYLTSLAADFTDGANWALSGDGKATPLGDGATSMAAGGNKGLDVGSPIPAAPGLVPGLTVTESGGSTDVAEGGATDTFDVVLDTAPAKDVTVTLTPDAQVDLGGGAGVAVDLTFTNANGKIAQTVTVTADDDTAFEGAHNGVIAITTASTDGDYDGLAVPNVTANIADDDPDPTFSGTSFENETPDGQYKNLGTDGTALATDAVVDIMNNAGQSPVDSTAGSLGAGDLGFNATWKNTRGGDGLSDGDFVGVTNFTGDVGAFSEGAQGYQISDPDGEFTVTFDAVDVSTKGDVLVAVDYFVNATGWESDDAIRIIVDTDLGAQTILDTTGFDIDDLGIEGSFITGVAAIPASATTATLFASLDSNAGSENLYLDNIRFLEGAGLSIAATDAVKGEGDAGPVDFTFTVTRVGDPSVATSVDFAVSGTGANPVDAADFGGAFPSGTVNFGIGDVTKTITVQATGDTSLEPSETFAVTLSNPSNALLVTPSATGTILTDDADFKTVSEIQGSGGASPLVDATVTLKAIVTADFQGDTKLEGFYVQEEAGDQDGLAATSEGIFIFDEDFGVDVSVGDLVEVTGKVAEQFDETSIIDVSDVTVVSSGNAPPAATVISDIASVDFETLEGMFVTFDQDLIVTEYFNLDRFGEIRTVGEGAFVGTTVDVDDLGRPFQFTQTNAPSVSGFAQHQADLQAGQIVIDDGSTEQNPNVIPFLQDGTDLGTDGALRGGDQIIGAQGVISFDFGDYRLQPTAPLTVEEINVRPEEPEDVGGDVTVAAFNVLNFFTTLDDDAGRNGMPLNEIGLEPRGANDLIGDAGGVIPLDVMGDVDGTTGLDTREFERQLDRLVTTILEIDADILGLVEVENDFNNVGVDALEFLVDQLNAEAGAGTYAFVDPGVDFVGGAANGDAITTALIYRPGVVQLAVGTTVEILTDSIVDSENLAGLAGETIFDGPSTNRAPVAATFEVPASGDIITVIVNHFKSKGSAGPSGDVDQNDGAGNANLTRLQGAQALDAWLDTDPTGSGSDNFLILGDLNAYAEEDPIIFLEGEGYTDLAHVFVGEDAASFVFDGQIGTLDYALASDALLPLVTGATEWQINSPEVDAIDYNLDFGRSDALFDGEEPFRSSDHDPIIIGLNFQPGAFVAAADMFAVGEDEALVAGDVLANDSDPTDKGLTVVAINGEAANVGLAVDLAAGGSVTVNADGTFVYAPDGDFEALNDGETDDVGFTYTIRASNGEEATGQVTITVDGANDAPIAFGGDFVVKENQTFVGDIDVVDPDQELADLSIVGGPDADLFQVDRLFNEIRFKNAPDFENPADADGDNVYAFQVAGADGGGFGPAAGVTVTVTNVFEADDAPSDGADAGPGVGGGGGGQVGEEPVPTSPEGQATPVFLFLNPGGGLFATTSAGERDAVQSNGGFTPLADDLSALPSETSVPGATPVQRFFDTSTGFHIYTLDPAEIESLSQDPDVVFEGEAFAAFIPSFAGGEAVYRFRVEDTGALILTSDESALESFFANPDRFTFEGEAFTTFDPGPSVAQSLGLGLAVTPVFLFANSVTGGAFLTSNVEEDFAVRGIGAFEAEDQELFVFNPNVAGVGGLVEVFRFFNPTTGAHFFTADPAERDVLLDGEFGFNFEGAAFAAFDEGRDGTRPIYRIFDLQNSVHVFTADSERLVVLLDDPSRFRFEGVGFFAATDDANGFDALGPTSRVIDWDGDALM